MEINMLIKLFLAHFLADFAFQPHSWVKAKNEHKIKSKYLYIHVLLHGILTYLFVANWTNVLLPIVVMLIHFAIDAIKLYRAKTFKWFVIDQLLHIVSLVVIWMLFTNSYDTIFSFGKFLFSTPQASLFILGLVLIWHPASILIYQATRKWQSEIKQEKDESLQEVGKWIGMLERTLIYIFILINQFSAIGFLLAAKSIFRFGDLTEKKDRKLTEYILIGTLLSFTFTIIVGLVIKTLVYS